MKNIGIFAGTFDPVHEGHIAFCLIAHDLCHLDKIYLLPERSPRNKQGVSSVIERGALLELAVASIPELEVLSVDDDFFSVENTLPKLQQKFPDSQITLLMGSDVACDSLPHWDNLETLLPAVSFAIGVRTTHDREQVRTVLQKLEATYGPIKYRIITSPLGDISSSRARQENK
jgi:nicotinate-nucleotide adenylyltransferase